VIDVERYRDTRYWAVYENGELLCLTVYKKGARAVKTRLERAERDIAAGPIHEADGVQLSPQSPRDDYR
jgi:hypothetical protein